jgi:prepilin-type N-terminal cleavage/methylation domain-containing protein
MNWSIDLVVILMLKINRKLFHKGFSLIELMVAVAILAMAIVGIFHAYSVGFMGMADARDRTVATNYAREAMEDIKNMDFEKIATTTKSFIASNRKYRVDVNVTTESDNLKKVSTIVSWEDRNGIRKTVESSMLVHFIEVFASKAAKIVLFTESYSILNTPIDSIYASTELTAVIKDVRGNTITDWGEDPNEGSINFSIISVNKFGTFSNGLTYIEVIPVKGRANTTFTSNGSMVGDFDINEIEASVSLPEPNKIVTDTTTIKITNGPVKIKLESNPEKIKASITNSSTITVYLKDATGKTLSKKEIFADVEINFSVFGEGNLSTSTITIPFHSGDPSDASADIILNSTGNPGLVTVIATATNLESGKTDVIFLGPPVAISISANPNPMYVDDVYSKITVSLLDINGFNTNPTDTPITISLELTENDTLGYLEVPHSWTFLTSDLEGIINETKFTGELSAGKATVTASGGGLPVKSVTIEVISSLVPDHMKLTASPPNVKAGGIEFSTIKAVVYDIRGKVVTNYIGTISFIKTAGIGTSSNYNFTNGIATIELRSNDAGTATITASSSDGLDCIPSEIIVGFYGTPEHIELNASSNNVKIGEENTSTITATVCDSTNIHVAEYTGYITFFSDLGTFSDDNPVYTTNGIATIELFSEAVGIATITASAGSILSNNICKVEFYEETTLTLVEGTTQYEDTENKVIAFDVEVTGENIEVDEMKIIWSDSSASQKLFKIAIGVVEVWSGNKKSGDIIDIFNATLLAGESNISNIKLTFGQDMTGKFPIEVTFYPPVSGFYSIVLSEPSQ